MGPLIEIKTVPVEIQIKTKNASLEYTRGTAEMEISRSEDGVSVKSRPVKVQFDSYESSQNAGSYVGTVTPTTQSDMKLAAQDSRSMAYEAQLVSGAPGALQVSANVGTQRSETEPQDSAQTASDTDSSTNSIDFDEIESLEIRYGMEKQNFDWKIEQGEFEFTPGDIEISVAQKPELIVKYLGGPIYVPASADPNYEPVDVKV